MSSQKKTETRGRKPLNPKHKKDTKLQAAVTQSEGAKVLRAAKREKTTTSEFIRRVVLDYIDSK